ncbi:MAG: hypothetical protein DRJ35_08525 [Thermoprotei archaeon]|nr:MAG: hypothetical protein DRJ35_08525 [Thermoprotei archaeon]
MESGYYYYYCGIIARPNDTEQYEDYADFDLHLNMVQESLKEKEPKRQPYLETSYFSPEMVEINFRFRASFRDGTEDIHRYIDLVTETLENDLNLTIIEFNIEGVS